MRELGAEILRICVEAGGVLSGEHGIGLEKRDYMHLVFSESDLEPMRWLHEVFDPARPLQSGQAHPRAARLHREQPPASREGRLRSGMARRSHQVFVARTTRVRQVVAPTGRRTGGVFANTSRAPAEEATDDAPASAQKTWRLGRLGVKAFEAVVVRRTSRRVRRDRRCRIEAVVSPASGDEVAACVKAATSASRWSRAAAARSCTGAIR